MKKILMFIVVAIFLVITYMFSVKKTEAPILNTPVVNSGQTLCKPEERKAEICTMIYAPVCAKVNVQCIKAPCPPIAETFPSQCNACANPLVESYVQGECSPSTNKIEAY